MTYRNLISLRSVLIALALGGILLAPFATAVAQHTNDGSQDEASIQPGRSYARANYEWPHATGPSYGVEDATVEGVLWAPAGVFQMREPLEIPEALRSQVDFRKNAAQYFALVLHPDLAVEEDTQRLIESLGGTTVVLPQGHVLVARLNRQAYDVVSASLGVVAIEPYHAAFKLDPYIGRTALPDPLRAMSDVYTLDVLLWSVEENAAAAAAIRALGGEIRVDAVDRLVVDLNRSLLPQLAAIESVHAVFEAVPRFLHAEETTTTVQTGQYNHGQIPYHDANIDGSGGGLAPSPFHQTLMVLDSGIQLDAGDLSNERADAGTVGLAHRKVKEYRSASNFTGGAGDLLGCDSPAQGGFTHGHVVAATALGNATDVPVSYNGTGWIATDNFGNGWKLDGVAPGAKLVAYDGQVTPPNGSCSDPLLDSIEPGDLYLAGGVGDARGSLLASYLDFGARVVNFSWGATGNAYSGDSIDIDQFLFDRKDAMVFVSAGNASVDVLPPLGEPDPLTIGAPGTLRNGLSIGSSQNANTVNSPESRSGFSSVGPAVNTTVNRIAPQLMAPGSDTGTLGVASEFACRTNDNNQTNPVLCDIISGVAGTSFASPAAAGAALVTRDYFAQGYYPNAAPGGVSRSITGALLKALLVASADFMTGANLTKGFRFNNEQGYGRIQLDNVLPLETWPASPSGLVVSDATFSNISGLASSITVGATQTGTFKVCNDNEELRIAVAWTDHPNAGNAALTNDLNLEVTAPSGRRYRGNYFSDDNNRNNIPSSIEDCAPLGASNPNTPDGLINQGGFSKDVCNFTGLPGKSLTVRPFDNANPTEAIYLSNNPDGDLLSDEGACIAGSEVLGPCDNDLDCRTNPPAGVGTCNNPGAYNQAEAGDWTIKITTGLTITGGSQLYSVAVAGGVCVGSSVRFDQGSYTCNESAVVTVTEIAEGGAFPDLTPGISDINTRTTIDVLENGIVVDTETSASGITFTQPDLGILSFESAAIPMTNGTARDPGNGALDIRDGDTLRVTYADKNVATGALDKLRKSQSTINCQVDVGFGSIVFAQFGQDTGVFVQGGCERNERNNFEFGFPDRYMDADEALLFNFAFNSNETEDLESVVAGLRCVNVDADSPVDCLPNTTSCADPKRTNNPTCPYMDILDTPKLLGFVPAGAAMSANFAVQMAGDGLGEPFNLVPTPTVEMVLEISASVSGQSTAGLAISRHRLNVDELATFYSTDFPTGGSEVLDSGPGAVGNNNEIAEDPITENGTFQSNDYRFESATYADLTAGGTKNLDLQSPWNFDGTNGGFRNGLSAAADETAANTFGIANWGEDKNFNGIEDGICLNNPAIACYNFGFNTDVRCGAGQTCTSVENNAGGSSFANNWSTQGGCGWQTKASGQCSLDANHSCFSTDDCNGTCQVDNNEIVSTFDQCGTGQPACPFAKQCNAASSINKLGPCTVATQAIDCGTGTCDDAAQICFDNDGSCNTGAGFTKGGIWHTGLIGNPGTPGVCTTSNCANYKIITTTGAQLLWWELMVTPVIAKVDQTTVDGLPNKRAEITEFAWNQSVNLADFQAAYTWEVDTDTQVLDPVDLFADAAILNIGGGPFGAVAEKNNPDLAGGWSLFAPVSHCVPGNQPCVNTADCVGGLCDSGGNGTANGVTCHFDSECVGIAGTGATCVGEALCTVNASGDSGNGSVAPNRVGDNACFFEGTITPLALENLGLAKPQDDDRNNDLMACSLLTPLGNTITCVTNADCAVQSLGTCVATGDVAVDEYVTAAGPVRNHVITAWNGPDMRFNTLEDIYGDTGNTFQGAIGFISFEGSADVPAAQSYGLGVDDVVLRWKEIGLQVDQQDCAVNGHCAVLDLDTTNVFEGQAVLGITLLEDSPSSPNDCYLDGDKTDIGYCSETKPGTEGGVYFHPFIKTCTVNGDCTATCLGGFCTNNGSVCTLDSQCAQLCVASTLYADDTDCNNNGDLDLVVKASSLAELSGEVVFLDQQLPATNEWKGTLSISSLGDSPGSLFMVGAAPTVTVTYKDTNDGTGFPCPNNVDPALHGTVQAGTTVFIGTTCGLFAAGATLTDNGDHDGFADTDETIGMTIKLVNNCEADLHNCSARISSTSPEVDCILKPFVVLGDILDVPGTFVAPDDFIWKVANINRQDPDDDGFSALFSLTISCDEIDGLAVPQSVSFALDLDVTASGTVSTWSETFEAGLGKFAAENLDAGLPGANNFEGLANSDGWRCQYSDPDWSQSNSYTVEERLNCYPNQTLAESNLAFWKQDGSGTGSPDGGRAKTGLNSMYYGIYLTTPAGEFTTPMAAVESSATPALINLGIVAPELSFWHQVSLIDGRAVGGIGTLRSADRGVVQIKTHKANGAAISDWTRLVPFQNAYDEQGYDNFFNCMFDPVDDGNTEDDFFDPGDPLRRTGPSSTCFPDFTYAYVGDTDEPFGVTKLGHGTTAPAASDAGSLGEGTWLKSRVDLTDFRGRRAKLRFMVTGLKVDAEDWETQFGGLNPSAVDDGWWVDDVLVNEVLSTPATFLIDNDVVKGCAGDPDVGCLTLADCTAASVAGPCDQPAPGCGAGCTSVTVSVETEPDVSAPPHAETLSSPGQPILMNASGSTAQCAVLQYRFSIGAIPVDRAGEVLREWSENPVFLDAPNVDTDYLVEARCSTDPGCAGQATIDVNVTCPTSGNLGGVFPTIRASAGPKNTWAWTPAKSIVVWKGALTVVSSYGGAQLLTANNALLFTDLAANPAPGAGSYYLVREVGSFCNNNGLWTTGGAGEDVTPGRDATLP